MFDVIAVPAKMNESGNVAPEIVSTVLPSEFVVVVSVAAAALVGVSSITSPGPNPEITFRSPNPPEVTAVTLMVAAPLKTRLPLPEIAVVSVAPAAAPMVVPDVMSMTSPAPKPEIVARSPEPALVFPATSSVPPPANINDPVNVALADSRSTAPPPAGGAELVYGSADTIACG